MHLQKPTARRLFSRFLAEKQLQDIILQAVGWSWLNCGSEAEKAG